MKHLKLFFVLFIIIKVESENPLEFSVTTIDNETVPFKVKSKGNNTMLLTFKHNDVEDFNISARRKLSPNESILNDDRIKAQIKG